jgi:hypothetical protein
MLQMSNAGGGQLRATIKNDPKPDTTLTRLKKTQSDATLKSVAKSDTRLKLIFRPKRF